MFNEQKLAETVGSTNGSAQFGGAGFELAFDDACGDWLAAAPGIRSSPVAWLAAPRAGAKPRTPMPLPASRKLPAV